MNRAVFLDRDGTLNVEIHYLYKTEDLKFIPGIIEAIRYWNNKGYIVVVVTNQAGVARGYYREDDVIRLHDYINRQLNLSGAHIDAFYYCPHHAEYGIGKYKVECNCRKPKTGMLDRAIADFNIDVRESYLFGDKQSDIEAGEKAGIRSFLVDGKQFDLGAYFEDRSL